MAKRNQNSFLKRQKEIKRQQKAQEKMMRRQGLKKPEPEEDVTEEITADGEETTAAGEETAAAGEETAAAGDKEVATE